MLFIDAEGTQIGVIPLAEAIAQAQAAKLDLVEVSPNADPPVCRALDYNRHRFQHEKRQKVGVKKGRQQLKEMKFRPVTDDADYQVKLRKMRDFIEKKHKVKVTIRFRGREITHQDLGTKLVKRIEEDLGDLITIEQNSKLEGRQMIMILAPKKA